MKLLLPSCLCRRAYRLYLPRDWTNDKSRRAAAHIPRSIRFKTKPQIALEQIRAALLAGVSPGVVLMDASYGSNSGLREAITGFGLSYVAAVVSTVKVRPVRKGDPKPRRLSVEALALKLPKHAWRTITWREGTNKSLRSRFARVRVRVAPQKGEARFAEETLLTSRPTLCNAQVGSPGPISDMGICHSRACGLRSLVQP